MKHLRLLFIITLATLSIACVSGQEKVFANYFDIARQSSKGTEVTGRIHLERNKDVLNKPIPQGYAFEIIEQQADLFSIDTEYDLYGRIMGVLRTEKEIPSQIVGDYRLTIALKDDDKVLNEFPVNIKIVDKTLWEILYERYKDITVTTAGGRMHGKSIPTDTEVEAAIVEIEKNNGRFEGFGCYTKHPMEYKENSFYDPYNGLLKGTIEFEWEDIANKIGSLGYAYARSEVYGPKGNPQKRKQLKKALYSAILAYTQCVPIEPSDVVIDGKPIGEHTGDGFVNLLLHGLMGTQLATHQWIITDPLVAPAVHLMPDILADIKNGDEQANRVHNSFVRFYQAFTSIVKNRRAIDNPSERWGEIQDTLRTSGAWADANLGHRSRIMLALPIIWADYNRPMTYVQYWYSDFYHDKPFKDFSFSPGWSPHGVVSDATRWLTKYNVPTHNYIQSGFQPDGSISHHIANATDMAMVAYGFEWLVDCFTGFKQFKDTEFKPDDKYYQFSADRIEKIYPKLIYKGRFDFLASGRSYLDDLEKFVSHRYLNAIDDLYESCSKDTKLSNKAALDKMYEDIRHNRYEYSGTDAYWINEFLVHRRGKNEKPFYASVKLKSKRTVGAEDFSTVRKSWHAGYGILPLKVSGDEYSHHVLSNFDWHMLPGLTEEWRTDPLPATGGAQASLPGDNIVAGVTSNGESGVAIYHHLPRETYSSATAYKTYHFIENKIVALGSNIRRLRPGQQHEITTCIDQSVFNHDLTICLNGKTRKIKPGESVDIEQVISSPTWLHIGEKGYVIYPNGKQRLLIKTGNEINITDRQIADDKPNYIIALGHGKNPELTTNNSYHYHLVPNVTASDMVSLMKQYKKNMEFKKENGRIHAIYSQEDNVWQTAFFEKGGITVGGLTVEAESPSLMILKDNGSSWKLTLSNPVPDINKETLVVRLSFSLKTGEYPYSLGGIYPRKGETVAVTQDGKYTRITVELPDKRDEEFYNYQAALYNAAPITINIPK